MLKLVKADDAPPIEETRNIFETGMRAAYVAPREVPSLESIFYTPELAAFAECWLVDRNLPDLGLVRSSLLESQKKGLPRNSLKCPYVLSRT